MRRKKLELQDYFIYAAFVFHIVMSALFIAATPHIYTITDVALGEIPPYLELTADAAYMTRVIYAAQICFWLCLWAVKFSLLALYRNLMTGLPSFYMKLWWCVVIICFLALVSVVAVSTHVCEDMHAFFTLAECNTAADVWDTMFCIYFAYAVDIVTDLLIMFLPLRLVWNLRIQRAQKICIRILFSSGFVCIAFATIRVATMGAHSTQHVEPKWMTLWTILETTVAIIIGCCPAFFALFRGRHNTQTPAYNTQGYIKHSGQRSSTHGGDKAIKLKGMMSSESRGGLSGANTLWEGDNNSQEELAPLEAVVVVGSLPNRGKAQSTTSKASVENSAHVMGKQVQHP
ncbi:hypothetical protein P153DRAFT_303712 [Dothidotthia symphoricarpi CBS 119687]|uniref:Rhodopsin domain-containing protein n=1 Tax=Dothidotthia symphoricarpi CBS 119687 TaxID=1392245 RepID=A0A6A5ZYY7_9PLEO|nr:uncharacterized protein P153DRAFT_303712 [Dothidotthia symphoricarpi CBS 119687]KAF2123531.1 hypothetical protein P153DRAFT_303712 [Dothidotthia symphoricarpi CBS 119687]